MMFARALALVLVLLSPGFALPAAADVTIDLNNPNIEPLPIAVPDFVAENPAAADMARRDFADVVAADLAGTGLFREMPHGRLHQRRSPRSTARCNTPTGRRSTPAG